MVNASNGGGSSAYGFDPSSSAPIRNYYLSGQGVQPFSNEDYVLHWTSHSFAGFTTNDGKADALRKVQSGIDLQALNDKAAAWQAIHSHVSDIHSRLQSAYHATFAAWSGDDADKAQATFKHAVDSAAAMKDRAQLMHSGMSQVSTGAQKLVGTSSDGPSTGAQIANAAIGFNVGGDGDGGHAVAAYDDFVSTLEGGRDTMPTDYTWQVKTSPGSTGGPGYQGSHNGGGGGGGGVGGVSAPHLGSGSSAHQSAGTPAMVHTAYTDGAGGGGRGKKPPKLPYDPPITVQDPPTDPPKVTTTPFDGGTGSSGYGSTPGLDTGSSLAGYDPSGGAGGAGLGGLGAGGGAGGGLGAGGLGAGGLGAGGLGGGLGAGGGLAGAGSGLAGGGGGGGLTGAGGLGNGAGGLAGEEAGLAGAGAAGRGGVGLPGQGVPRGVGGGGGDESERERSTWLEEDDDVWGGSDAPPSVIS